MKKETKDYISNPFILVFNGLEKLFKVNQTHAIVILVLSLLGSIGNFFPGGGGGASNSPGAGSEATVEPSISTAFIVLIVAVVIGVLLVVWFISTVFGGYVNYVAYKTSKNQTTTFSEAIKAVLNKFWTIVLIDIIVFFKVLGGLLLLIVPGIRAILRYQMVYIQMFDENLKATEAIKKAKWLTKDHLLEVFGMATAAGIVPFIGQLLLIGGQALMYPQLKTLKTSSAPKPKVHWLNYLGFILIGLIILFVVGIISLINLLRGVNY